MNPKEIVATLMLVIPLFWVSIIAAVSGVLAFFIFRRNRFAVVAMLVLVIGLQLFTWFVAHSPAGTLISIVVAGFLLRGARRIFQDHAERDTEANQTLPS
jgi:Co/Zn/Cd efflux system component